MNNEFWQLTPLFTLGLPGDIQFTPRNFWEVELLLESKERRNRTTTKRVSA